MWASRRHAEAKSRRAKALLSRLQVCLAQLQHPQLTRRGTMTGQGGGRMQASGRSQVSSTQPSGVRLQPVGRCR